MRHDEIQTKAILSTRDVCALVGLSRVTLYRAEKAGRFPKRRQITAGRVGWLRSEIEAWILNRPAAA